MVEIRIRSQHFQSLVASALASSPPPPDLETVPIIDIVRIFCREGRLLAKALVRTDKCYNYSLVSTRNKIEYPTNG